jgi:tripartite-type tricarboxylate transporter receptor subunit TctC
MYAPAGTPMHVVRRLNEEIVRVIGLPELRDRFIATGLEPVGSSPDELAERMQADYKKWRGVVTQIGLKLD